MHETGHCVRIKPRLAFNINKHIGLVILKMCNEVVQSRKGRTYLISTTSLNGLARSWTYGAAIQRLKSGLHYGSNDAVQYVSPAMTSRLQNCPVYRRLVCCSDAVASPSTPLTSVQCNLPQWISFIRIGQSLFVLNTLSPHNKRHKHLAGWNGSELTR